MQLTVAEEFLLKPLYASHIPVITFTQMHVFLFISFYSSYDYDSVCSDVSPDSSTKDDDNVKTESNGQLILANVNLSENYLNEYCEEQPFIYEGNRVLDWTVDVEDDDIKEDEEEEKLSVYEENQMSNWRSDVEKDDIDEEDIDIVQVI